MNTLKLFDLTKLLSSLNEQVSGGNFSLVPKIFEESKRNPFINKIDGSERQTVGKYHVINNGKKVGYLFFEQGIVPDDSDTIAYEKVKLKLLPIRLKDGREVPKSTIKIYVEDMYNVTVERKDHTRIGHLFWKQTDLSSILPNNYFLQESVSGRIVK
jgi:hypothetical protein